MVEKETAVMGTLTVSFILLLAYVLYLVYIKFFFWYAPRMVCALPMV